MNEDELLEFISDVKREASNNQKLTIARDLILDIAKNCIDAEKQKKLLIASDKTTGHYITIVDMNKEGFLYYDPWGKNPRNKNGGSLELFTFDEFKKCNKKRMLIISDKL